MTSALPADVPSGLPSDVPSGLPADVIGNGSPVLLLHGLGGDRRQLQELAASAFDGENQVIAPDLRAHGQAELDVAPDQLTFTRLTRDVEDLLARLGTSGGLIVVGVSMGAAIATELLARRNVEIAAAVFLRPAWLWKPDPANLAAFPVIGRLLRDYGTVEGRTAFLATDEYAATARVSATAAHALLAQFDAPRAVERAQRLISIPRSAPVRPDPRELPPRLIIGCERDPAHPLPTAQALHRDLGGNLSVVAARYDAPEEHAQQVSAAITRFMSDTRTHGAIR